MPSAIFFVTYNFERMRPSIKLFCDVGTHHSSTIHYGG